MYIYIYICAGLRPTLYVSLIYSKYLCWDGVLLILNQEEYFRELQEADCPLLQQLLPKEAPKEMPSAELFEQIIPS